MSQWINSVETHPLHNNLKALAKSLLEAHEIAESESGPERIDAINSIERLQEVLQYLLKRLDSINPNLVVMGTLDALNANATRQSDILAEYANTGKPSHLAQANEIADQSLLQIHNLPTLTAPGDIEGMSAAASSFRKAVGRLISSLDEEHAKLQAKYNESMNNVAALINDINNQKGRLDTAIAEFQSQFSQAEANRTNQSLELKTRIDAVLTQFQQQSVQLEENRSAQFLEANESRRSEFTEDISEYRTSFNNFISDSDSKANAAIAQIDTQAQDYLKQLDAHQKRAEDIVHVIGNTGMVGGYQRVANQERNISWVWQGVTVLSMCGLIVFGVYTFWTATHLAFNWGIFSARIFAAVTFSVLAAYAAQQAAKHQEIERRNRRIELELASIDPYIVLLPEDVRNEVKRQLAERFFGQSEPVQNEKVAVTSGTATDVAKVLLDAVKTTLEQMNKK